MTFASDEDRIFFVKLDESHQGLKEFLSGKLLGDILVLDFVAGSATSAANATDC
jgi:hypothetical protein